MFDKEYLTLITTNKLDNKRLLNYKDEITVDIIQYLRTIPRSQLSKCFVPMPNIYPSPKFKTHLICEKCGKTYIKEISKTALFNYI